jgi:hypothetical protein
MCILALLTTDPQYILASGAARVCSLRSSSAVVRTLVVRDRPLRLNIKTSCEYISASISLYHIQALIYYLQLAT